MKEKIARKIKGVTFALLYIGIYMIVQTCLFLEVNYLEADILNYTGVVTILASALSLVIFVSIMYMRNIKVKQVIKARPVALLDVVLSFSLALGFRIVTGVYLRWAETVPVLSDSLEKARDFSYDFTTMTLQMMLATLAAICIIAPVFEEILFRALVLRELSDVMNVYLAIVLQGVLFGIAHSVLTQAIFAAVYGIILGVLYYKTKNIVIVSLGHIFFNCSAILEIKSDDDLITLGVIGTVMSIISLIAFLNIYRRKKERLLTEDTGGNNNG